MNDDRWRFSKITPYTRRRHRSRRPITDYVVLGLGIVLILLGLFLLWRF